MSNKQKLENKFYYGQKVFYASEFEKIKSFEIKEICSDQTLIKLANSGRYNPEFNEIESSDNTFIRLANPHSCVGVIYSTKKNEFMHINYSSYYREWYKSNLAFVAISLDENEVYKIISQNIISNEKKEIEDLQKKILKSWALIQEAQKYL